MKTTVLFVLLLSLMIAGCVEETGKPNQTSSPNVTQTALTPTPQITVPTATPNATSTPNAPVSTTEVEIITTSQPEISGWPPADGAKSDTVPSSNTNTKLASGEKHDVIVMEVLEGDVITVMFPEGGVETVKLLGIDVPKTEPTNNRPHVPKSITDLRCLADIGRDAKQFVNFMLVGENCSIELDQTAGLRENGMLLGYVYRDGDFNKRLLEEGYAMVSDINHSKRQEYLQIQNEQSEKQTGLWACVCDEELELAPLTVGFYRIQNDAMNNDVSNLNDEYIVLKNYGNSSVNLLNWSLRNDKNESYALPPISMPPGSTITLRSGSGVNAGSDYYLDSSSPIWGNQHDSAYLYNSEGTLADYCRW
ncbi:MAG: lamin tail domain-containing protein [Halobacteriota archaeon]